MLRAGSGVAVASAMEVDRESGVEVDRDRDVDQVCEGENLAG